MKTLRVNTGSKQAAYEDLKPEYRDLGNRGLVARVGLDEISPVCDPIGPGNKLVIAQSLLAGTILATSGRMSIGGKSPLTGGIKEANVGGMIGKALTAHGIKLLIVEGAPANDDLFILLVKNDGSPELIERNDLVGMGNFTLVHQLREAYGQDSEMLVIGPAGEKLFKNACILATDYSTKEPCRAAGRGGLGAVMGARRLKAIVVQKATKPYRAQPARPEEYRAASSALHKAIAENGAVQARTKYGTFGGVRKNAETGILPVKNFRSIPFDGIDKIDAQAIVDQLDRNGGKYGLSCQTGCLIKCSNYYVDKGGRHTASSLNYEALGLCGPNLLIDSLDTVAEIKQICDDAGIDAIEMGAALGLLMEAGILAWGDEKAAIDMAKQIVSGGEFSNEFQMGIEAFGTFLKVERIPAVRGQSFAAYDVRVNKGMGFGYLAGTMGADHTVGGGDPDAEGSYVKSTIFKMNMMAAFDSVFCLFMMQPILMDKTIAASFFNVLSAYFGQPWDMQRLLKVGSDSVTQEFQFNQAAGVGKAVMPKMFVDEKSGISCSAFDIDYEDQTARIQAAYLGGSLS